MVEPSMMIQIVARDVRNEYDRDLACPPAPHGLLPRETAVAFLMVVRLEVQLDDARVLLLYARNQSQQSPSNLYRTQPAQVGKRDLSKQI